MKTEPATLADLLARVDDLLAFVGGIEPAPIPPKPGTPFQKPGWFQPSLSADQEAEFLAAEVGLLAVANRLGLADYLPRSDAAAGLRLGKTGLSLNPYHGDRRGATWHRGMTAFREMVAKLAAGTPPGPRDWLDLAETCRELAGRLDATAGEPLEREPLAPLLAKLAANSRRVELSTPPLSWVGFYWDDGAQGSQRLEYRCPNGPATKKTFPTFDAADEPPGTARRQTGDHDQTRQEAVAALQSWVRHAERKAAELTTPQVEPATPPAANLGRQFFNVASWPLFPFGDRPQRLPTDKPRGAPTFSAAAAPYMIPPCISPVIEGTGTPGETGRLERGGLSVELYFPTDADRATLAAALPGCDLDAPPWHAVQARLLSAGLSANWQHLTAPAAVALLARTGTAPPPRPRPRKGAKARKAKADKPRTKRERLREQRLAFCRPRVEKGDDYGDIYADYHKWLVEGLKKKHTKLLKDDKASRHTLRLTFERWEGKYSAE